jgi:hypothetical protein
MVIGMIMLFVMLILVPAVMVVVCGLAFRRSVIRVTVLVFGCPGHCKEIPFSFLVITVYEYVY